MEDTEEVLEETPEETEEESKEEELEAKEEDTQEEESKDSEPSKTEEEEDPLILVEDTEPEKKTHDPVSYDRFHEVNETNKKLVQTLDSIANRLAPPKEEEEEELDPVVKKAVEKRVAVIQEQSQLIYGGILERLDDFEAKDNIPGYRTNPKLVTAIEKVRNQAAKEQNTYLSRKQAYDYLIAKGLLKKASEAKKVIVDKRSPKKETHTTNKTAGAGPSTTKKSSSIEKRLEGKTF